MSEPQYPPTEHRLAELRAAGEVPRTDAVLDAGAVLGLATAATLAGASIPLVRSWAASCFNGTRDSCVTDGGAVIVLLLAFAVTVAAAVIFFGMLQTRFLVTAPKASGQSGVSLASYLGTLIAGSVVTITLAVFAFDAFVSKWPQSGAEFFRSLQGLLWWLAGAAFFIAIVSFFVAVLRFRHRVRMTREEVEAEFRELEMKPEVRQAMGEWYRQERTAPATIAAKADE